MGDILLGAKRPARSRRIAKRLFLAALLLCAVAAIGYVWFQRATRYSVPRGSAPRTPLAAEGGRLALGDSSLERRGRVWVLRLAGDPFAIGVAQGRLLGTRGDASAALDPAVVGETRPRGWL